jgi:Ca-activated chloride channel family protein
MIKRSALFLSVRHILIAVLVSLTLGLPSAQAQESVHLTINRVDDTSFPVVDALLTVTGATGLPIQGLTSDAFSASEDGRPVQDFTLSEMVDSTEPISVVVAVDTSGSMRASARDSAGKLTTALANTQQAAKSFINGLQSGDQVGIVTFSNEAETAAPLLSDLSAAEGAIDGLTAEGETALYDAIVASVAMLKNLPAGRKAIILLADGENNSSTFTFDEAMAEAARWSIPIYPIGFGNVNQSTTNKIASLTGGYAQISPDSSELRTAFETVLQVLRHQYLLTFSSSSSADGTEHSLLITLTYEGAQISGSHTFVARPGQVLISLPGLDSGAIIGGDVRLAPEILAPARLREVTLAVDGTLLTTLMDEPFQFAWDTTAIPAGDHLLSVTATDAAGNSGKFEIQLTVQPPVSVKWIAPTEGQEISGSPTLTADVDALAGITGLEFFVDGQSIGTASGPPYELEWNSGSVEPGEHTLRVVATDLNNRQAEDEIRVNVALGSNTLILVLALVVVLGGVILAIPLALRRRARIARSVERTPTGPLPERGHKRVVLHEIEGIQPGHMWELGEEEIRIGRKRAENDIPAAGRSASRNHALIKHEEGQYILRDLNPANPTLINGQAIDGEQVLNPGDTIQIGESTFRLETAAEGQQVS